MKTLILHYYYGAMDGVFISTMDLYYNLSKIIDVEYRIITDKPAECIQHLFKNNNADLVKFVTTDKNLEADTIICSARFLETVKFSEICKCKKLIVLDSLDFVRRLQVKRGELYKLFPKEFKKKDVIILCNPANMQSRFKYTMVEYFQKLSRKRLENSPAFHARFFDHYYTQKPFLQLEFDYTRVIKPWMAMEDGTFFENVGRLIFEHLWSGKTVNYNCEGMYEKDGLYYYLDLFGIDGSVDHKPLKISKEEIEDKLFMKKDDPLIELVS